MLKEKERKETVVPLKNEKIRAPFVQVIDEQGVNLGAMPCAKAQELALAADLDLVLLAEKGNEGLPLVKIMDFGKEAYEKKKKRSEARKHQKVIKVKELKIRPKIGEHDFQHKIAQFAEFLKEGMRIKVTLCFRGREMSSKRSLGTELFKKIELAWHNLGLSKTLAQEGDAEIGQSWTRVYYLKSTK